MEESNVVQQRDVTFETVERWIANEHIQGVRLPEGYPDWPEDEKTRLLKRMFEIPAQLEEESIEPAPRHRGRAVPPDEWGPTP